MSRRFLITLVFALFIASLSAQMPAVAPANTPAPSLVAGKIITIYLVRHAEKASPTGDTGLSEAGAKRAECLATTLADASLQAIYTTEYKRTKATAAPTATKAHLTPIIIPGADTNKLVAALQQEAGHSVLVVGHSNTVPEIIDRLGAGKITIKDDEYDHLYVVTIVNGQAGLASLRYCH